MIVVVHCQCAFDLVVVVVVVVSLDSHDQLMAVEMIRLASRGET